ncbi:radical SAM/SPASM domain-containing protein [Candidatus Heimdallarchaeota archaeon B3_Heim]|nr:MAG: radical SAM/SPASM domain-containing protein [Candidatus Heimdallarchaeota archaeon B3_Heim]
MCLRLRRLCVRVRRWWSITMNQEKSSLIHQREGQFGEIRLHLRKQGENGLLVINASRILQLNQTATFFVERILDGTPEQKILNELKSLYRVTDHQAKTDLNALKDMITSLSTTEDICPIHSLNVEESNIAELNLTAPLRMDLALTYRCNNTCSHCYNQTESPNASELETNTWKDILERLWEISIPHVTFTGGEPTLRQDLSQLIERAELIGIVTGLITNGRKLKEQDYVNNLVEAGLDHFQITLESANESIHNQMVGSDLAWNETIAGIKNAVETPIYTLTNTTLTKLNVETIIDTIGLLNELEVEQFACNSIIYAGKGKNVSKLALNERELLPVLERIQDSADDYGMEFIWYTPTRYCDIDPVNLGLGVKRCSASHLAMAIEPNGTVIPCQSYYEGLGNILKDPWEKIWNHPLSIEIRTQSNVPDECQTCGQLNLCGAGCPLSYTREEYICPESKAND